MSRRQHPSPTLVALLALFTLTGAACSGSVRGRAPFLQHAAITPIQISSPVSVPEAEPQAPRPVEDPVLKLIADSDRHFKAGQKELEQGHFEAAKLEFNKSLDVLLESPYGARTEPRIREHFDRLVDRISARTVAAGMVAFPLQRSGNVRQQRFGIDKALRAHMKAQRPCILWFTGLPGAGKSTILNLVEQRLTECGLHTYALDGDNLRRGLNRDLGFTDFDRVENIRRAGEVARLMVDAGLVVLCAFVSPFRAERRVVRELVGPEEFIEVFVDTPVEVCVERDPKGLYAKARDHTVRNVTGIDSPYEAPEHADLRVETVGRTPESAADAVLAELHRRGILRVG